jgi:hypothetical protein
MNIYRFNISDLIRSGRTLKALSNDLIPLSSVVVIPYTNLEQANRALEILRTRAGPINPDFLLIHDDIQLGPIAIFNHAYQFSNHEILIYMAQDVFPSRNWFNLLQAELHRTPWGLLAFNDGKWQGKLASFGAIRRSWIKDLELDTPFFSGYFQHYADVELTLIAMQKKMLHFDPLIICMEIDYEKDSKSINRKDQQTFSHRKKSRFDGLITDAGLLRLFN